MKINLTSNTATYYWKYFMPIFFGTATIFSLFYFLFQSHVGSDFSFLVLLIPMSLYFVYYANSLKFVQGDNYFIYVKSYRKSDRIPLTSIKNVDYRRFPNVKVDIFLNEKSVFGKTISFIPYSKWFLFGSEHPVVKEIREYLNELDRENSNIDQ